MITSLASSFMNMTADVYTQQNGQSSSGAITREWVYDKTIQCKVMPFKASNSDRNDSKKFNATSNAAYEEHLRLTMKCLIPISKRFRITGIRSNIGEKVYLELDRIDAPDTIFEVVSSHTVLDPFGNISYYTVVLQRVSVQNDTNQGS